ncbi:MAG: flavodoxin-dependent (E)-4-hydroxy-3-methylbut-2-enyl-diphosphate synthase [Candidatus Firestonebacteria bacterium]
MEQLRRRKTKEIKIGKVIIGGKFPVSIQSMTKTDTRDVLSTINQIKELEKAGCEIVRVAVPDEISAKNLRIIKKEISIPLVGDIHFNYKLALMAIDSGVDKIRINPGNIGEEYKIKEILKAAKLARIPIRIGVNSGSLEKFMYRRRGEESLEVAKKMVSKALSFIKLFEKNKFFDIVLSLKASDTLTTINAYKLIAKKCDYPFHIGITEAGTLLPGTVKSSIGMGILLSEGMGDTLRVSLASSPLDEVRVGKEILKTLKLRKEGVDLIVCPTCGRCEINIFKIADEVEKNILHIKKSLKLAVMGCVVNGPGEAKEADLGLAGGKKLGIIFKYGQIIKKVKEKDLVKEFLKELRKICLK